MSEADLVDGKEHHHTQPGTHQLGLNPNVRGYDGHKIISLFNGNGARIKENG